MTMKFDLYGIAKIIRSGKARELELVENAVNKLGSTLLPLSVTEKFVFVANRESGQLFRFNYGVVQETVQFSNPVPFEIEENVDRLDREGQKIVRNIVEALTKDKQDEVDKYKAEWLGLQREKYKLEESLNINVGYKSSYIKDARKIVTEAIESTRSGKLVMRKGVKTSLIHKLLDEGSISITPDTPSISVEPKSRQQLIHTKIVEARQNAKKLIESPVFSEYVVSLLEGNKVDVTEAVEFIADNYQEIFCLSLSEQTELFYNTHEKMGGSPSAESVVEGLLHIRDYAIKTPEIRKGLEQLTEAIGAQAGDFHKRVQLIENTINTKSFTPNDVSVLRTILEKVLANPSEFLAPEFIVELRKAHTRIVEMVDNGNYDDRLVASTIYLLSNFYPGTMKLGESKKNDAEYEKYFQSKLDKYGVSSPDEIPDDKKDDFFDEVDSGWTADDEKKGKVKPEEDEEDENADKNMYGESGACDNCGAPTCLCNGLNEMPEMEDTIEDPDDFDSAESSSEDDFEEIGDPMKKYHGMAKSDVEDMDYSDEEFAAMESEIRQLKKYAKGQDLELLEDLEDKIIIARATNE